VDTACMSLVVGPTVKTQGKHKTPKCENMFKITL